MIADQNILILAIYCNDSKDRCQKLFAIILIHSPFLAYFTSAFLELFHRNKKKKMQLQ